MISDGVIAARDCVMTEYARPQGATPRRERHPSTRRGAEQSGSPREEREERAREAERFSEQFAGSDLIERSSISTYFLARMYTPCNLFAE